MFCQAPSYNQSFTLSGLSDPDLRRPSANQPMVTSPGAPPPSPRMSDFSPLERYGAQGFRTNTKMFAVQSLRMPLVRCGPLLMIDRTIFFDDDAHALCSGVALYCYAYNDIRLASNGLYVSVQQLHHHSLTPFQAHIYSHPCRKHTDILQHYHNSLPTQHNFYEQ
jgi:hypothetical protein